MKLLTLSVVGFRGLNFSHNFNNEKFIVITGVNGSGKSTILEVVDILLSRQINAINEPFANQITDNHAGVEISVKAEAGEIDYLAEKMHSSQPNTVDVQTIARELREKVFVNDVYRRKIVVQRPTLGWAQNNPSYIQEFINDNQVNLSAGSMDTIISQQYFNVMSRQILLKFEQLENINLQITQRNPGSFSIQDIFASSNDNFAQRQLRTNLSASPLLDSLIKYGTVDDSELLALIREYEQILDPIKLTVMKQNGGLSHIALMRDGKNHYTIDTASSGQKKAIVLATLKYVWQTTALKPVVLLDEPENSMHPDLTTRIFQSLSDLTSNEEEPSFIIATHSPEVVASNSRHVFRITTKEGRSRLTKIQGLDERASIMEELGVKFSLDYVAQKIVFVEGATTDSRHGISDAVAYQTLIDPLKEKVLFVDCGSRRGAERRYVLQRELMERLKQSSSLYEFITDRDNTVDQDEHTVPFWDVEYLYIANLKLLMECSGNVLMRKLKIDEINTLMPVGVELDKTKTKDIWIAFMKEFSITKEQAREIQLSVLKKLREEPRLRNEAVEKLISKF